MRVLRWQAGPPTGRTLAAIGLVVMLGMLGACGGEGGPSPAAGAQRGGAGEAARVVAVETAPVERGVAARTVTVSGTVEPIRSVGVNSQLAGALVSVSAQEGDAVREGQVLARLDDRELRALLASAEASLEVAQATFRRAEQLREAQVVTAAEYERDRGALLAAQAQLQQLRTRLGYATVRAPITGVVTEKRVEAGDAVAPQTRLFTVADLSTMVVRVPVSELDVTALAAGEPAAIALDALPGRLVEGRIRRVFPAADSATRLVPVEVALTGTGARLARPGFLARVTFELDVRDDALLVPAGALVGGQQDPAVFVVTDGRAARRAVETGLNVQGRVEIRSGLSAGEQVVVVGHNALRDGAAVRVVGAAAAAADTARGAAVGAAPERGAP